MAMSCWTLMAAEPVGLGRVERELAAGGGAVVEDAVADGEQQGQVGDLDIGELRLVHGASSRG
jgi:hypothetical protein